MASVAPSTAKGGAGTSAPAPAAPVQAMAFRSQTQPTIKRPGNVLSTPMGTAPIALPDTQIPPTTLLRCIYLEVTISGGVGGTAFAADAPLNILSTVNFHDAQGTSIVGSFSSFELAMAQKYFGFTENGAVETSAVYTSTIPNASMVFRIPVEVVSRTGVGSQINTDTQSPLVLSLAVNSSANVYTATPTTQPTVSVVVSYGGYWNQSGNPTTFATPTAVGSLNYVNWTNYVGLAGQQQFQLSNIGLGNSILNLMFVNRLASNNARSDTGFANPLQVAYRGNVLGQWSQTLWKQIMSESYGYSNATSDAGIGSVAASAITGLNVGVYNIPFNQDFTAQPGNTLFYQMLNTAVGDSIELTGSWPTQSTLYEIINFLAVSGPVAAVQGR